MSGENRIAYARIVAAVVVLVALAKWIPAGGEELRFGLGAPLDALRKDRTVLELGGDEGIAWLRSGEDPGREFFWKGALRARRLMERDGDPDDVLQVRGLRRNRFFLLLYTLYPYEVVGKPYERGSRVDDPVRDDADWLMTVTHHLAPIKVEKLR